MRLINRVIVYGFFAPLFLGACGGPDREKEEVEPEVVKNPWQKTTVTDVTEGGLLSTNVAAVPDGLSDDIIHFVYLVDAHEPTEEEPNPPIEYTLRHSVWSQSSQSIVESFDIVTLDNTLEFALTIDENNTLYVAYRGGNNAHCNTQQSDTMLAVKNPGGQWQEYTGGIGYSGLRNPVYTDGDAGDYPSLAIDSSGNVHMAFQFFWEGCDSNNALHPDVLYIQKQAGAFDSFDENDEEQVEGNDYAGTNYQNAVGFHNSLILDAEENPVVFYGAREVNYNEHGLRVGRRVDGQWQTEWVDRGCFIGDVSAAIGPEGELAVAYYIDQCTEHLSYTEDDGNALRFAVYFDEEWHITTIDEATKVGSYTKLVFDNEGYAAIAYYETESWAIGGQSELYNLKLARFLPDETPPEEGQEESTEVIPDTETPSENDGAEEEELYSGIYVDANLPSRWFKQRVEEAGDIGVFNSLWFDSENNTYISSFSKTDNTIYLFTEGGD